MRLELGGLSPATAGWLKTSPDKGELASWGLFPLVRVLRLLLDLPSEVPLVRCALTPARRKLYTFTRGVMVRKKQSREQLVFNHAH